MKRMLKELQRIYELIGDLEAEKNFKCDRCGCLIEKGDRYFATRLREMNKNIIISERDIITLCSICAKQYKRG